MKSFIKVLGTILTLGVPLFIDVLARRKVSTILNNALHVHVRANVGSNTATVTVYLEHVQGRKYRTLTLEADDVVFDRN